MPRIPGHATAEGAQWTRKLERAQRKVDDAERERDALALEALTHGLGIRGVALALRIDKTTAQRRYGREAQEGTGR